MVNESPELQLAHVLFMDIVEYSTRSFDQQRALVTELQKLVRSQPDLRRTTASQDLLCLPTGDGMALVFFREPLAPLQCAVHISRALRGRTDLRLRMGIHSGPVYRVEDINANANVSGGGINLAQRVMDCGDAGHILLTAAAAELVAQVGAWPLQDLGVHEVKHGVRVHVFNLHGRDFGNADLPARLKQRRVVLLYRRGTDPDAGLLETLAARLSERGCEVFWDRQLKVGMRWAEELERRIREADAVIPLVSTASMHDELLVEALKRAREAREKQGGRPRILPVRLGYHGALPEELGHILKDIEYAWWEGPEQTNEVVGQLVEGLEDLGRTEPARVEPARTEGRAAATRPEPAAFPPSSAGVAHASESTGGIEAVGGAVPLDSRFYVTRASDEVFLTAIDRKDSIVLVNGARQMGKTSLLARGLQRAREAGARVALTDFQWLNSEQLESADTLFRTLGEAMADQLDLDTYPDEVWNERSGASVNFQRYMRRAVLAGGDYVVWGLDEVDRLFDRKYASEVFGLFRSWHNARALDPTGPWSRLTLAISYATEAHLFITDINQSPFNVGTRVGLKDFTREQVADLNARYGAPLADEDSRTRFYRLLNGHPYLTRRGLNELAQRGCGLPELEGAAGSNEGPFGDHLRRILVLLATDPELTDAVRGLLRGQPLSSSDYFYRLRSAGLVTGDSPREAQLRCHLYAGYLERHLL